MGHSNLLLNKLAQQGFTKEDCMFIDDQKENVGCRFTCVTGYTGSFSQARQCSKAGRSIKEVGILQEVPAKSFFVAHKSALLFSGLAVGGLSLAYAYGRPLL